MDWGDFGAAIALVLVIEGIMPFLSPKTWKETLRTVSEMDEATLRSIGFTSMMLGVILLYLVRG